ncbi:MAG: hypothetical protein RLZZ428_90 [Pseudomonadota bacterium]|jgi:hypothetical protein
MKKIALFLIVASTMIMAGGDIRPVGGDMSPNTNQPEVGGIFGGGCSYNPNNKGADMMFVLLMLTAAAYPLRGRLVGKRS